MLRSASALGTSKKMLTNGWPPAMQRLCIIVPLMPGHDSRVTTSSGSLKLNGWRNIAGDGKQLFISVWRTFDLEEKLLTRNNSATMKRLSSISPRSSRYGRSCANICIGIHSSFQEPCRNSHTAKQRRLVLYGSVRPWKCTNYARDTTKGMHGSICGKTGTDWINGRFGQEQRRWITTQSYRRTLLSKSIGVTLRIESSISFLAHASIACASNCIVQLYQFLSTKSTKSERVSKTAHGIGTWSTNGRSSNTRLTSRMERI